MNPMIPTQLAAMMGGPAWHMQQAPYNQMLSHMGMGPTNYTQMQNSPLPLYGNPQAMANAMYGMRGQEGWPTMHPDNRPVTSDFRDTDIGTYYRDPKKVKEHVIKAVTIRKEVYRSACRHCGSHFKDLREKCENCGSNDIEDLHTEIEKKDARIEYQKMQLMAMQKQILGEQQALAAQRKAQSHEAEQAFAFHGMTQKPQRRSLWQRFKDLLDFDSHGRRR